MPRPREPPDGFEPSLRGLILEFPPPAPLRPGVLVGADVAVRVAVLVSVDGARHAALIDGRTPFGPPGIDGRAAVLKGVDQGQPRYARLKRRQLWDPRRSGFPPGTACNCQLHQARVQDATIEAARDDRPSRKQGNAVRPPQALGGDVPTSVCCDPGLVENDFGEKGFFVHQGTRFVDEARTRGVLDPGNGMGVSVGDFNNDGRLDLHMTNMSSTAGNRILGRLFPGATVSDQVLVKVASGNTLFENAGGGRFRDVTADVGGLSASWSWGGGFIDIDNDGAEDLYTPNGFISGRSMKDT